MESGSFVNEFDTNLQIALVVFVTATAPTFGYFYNRLMDQLGEHEHTSLYVAIGVFITLVFVGLLSWKAALLSLVVFGLTGMPMIAGEFKRTERKKRTPRVRRLPYKANGIIDDAKMASVQAHRAINQAIVATKSEEIYKHLTAAALELDTITGKLAEVKQIQLEK